MLSFGFLWVRLGWAAVDVAVTHGNRISEEAMATLPPRDDGAESVDWGAPGDARYAWKDKFFTA